MRRGDFSCLIGVSFILHLAMLVPVAQANVFSNQSADTRLPALNPTTITDSGVPAPLGGYWSELENDLGNTSESNGVPGVNILPQSATPFEYFRLADDFIVSGGRMVITGVRCYAYNSGVLSSISPFLDGSCKIVRPAPQNTPTIFGTSVSFSQTYAIPVAANGGDIVTGDVYRCFNSQYPDPGTAPSLWRHIQQLNFTFGEPVVLSPNNYWIDFGVSQGFGLSGFAPCTTHDESRTPPGASNAFYKQFDGFGTGWVELEDTGSPPSSAPDLRQELPFVLVGHVVRDPVSMAVAEGVLFSGTVNSLLASDNSRVFILCDEAGPNSELRIGFNTSISYTGRMAVTIECSTSRSDQVQFYSVFNPTSNTWTQVGSNSMPLLESTFSADVLDAQQFVGPTGEVLFRAVVIPSSDLESADGWTNAYNFFSVECHP